MNTTKTGNPQTDSRDLIHRNVDAILTLPGLRGLTFQMAGFTTSDYTVNTTVSGDITPDELMTAGLDGLSDMLNVLTGKGGPA